MTTWWPFSQAEIEGVSGRIVELLLERSSRPVVATVPHARGRHA